MVLVEPKLYRKYMTTKMEKNVVHEIIKGPIWLINGCNYILPEVSNGILRLWVQT